MRVGVTDSEYYYDERGPWREYKDDALWNMKWRARLRRYKRIPNEIKAMAPLNAADQFEQYFNDIIH
jgi:hypothetical protein